MGLAGFGCAAGPMSPVSLLLRKITWGERPGSCSASIGINDNNCVFVCNLILGW